jgi:c-di-GMP-binding flagellar brake protein YcgR
LVLCELPASVPSEAITGAGQPLRLEFELGAKLVTCAGRVAAVTDRSRGDFWVSLPSDPAAYQVRQQREFLRVPIVLPVTVSVRYDGAAVSVRGESINLGGGGLCLATRAPLRAGSDVRLGIVLESGGPPIACNAHVLDCRGRGDSPTTHARSYESRLAFVGVDERTQSAILRCCFQQQIAQRRNKLA